MNKEVLNFLKNYTDDVESINRLLISSFVFQKNISNFKNKTIKNLLIDSNSLEYSTLLSFLDLLKKDTKIFDFEYLLELFEFVISPSDKLINGAIYTPKNIRNYITQQSFNELSYKSIDNIKIADIACGCGGFLIDASLELRQLTNKSFKKIFQENIFGVDIQKYSIERTEILLSLLALTHSEDEKEFQFNLHAADSLEFKWLKEDEQIKKNNGFDLILGNPPYVCSRNMDNRTKGLLKNWSVCATGHPDLYIPFFQIGYELLAQGGILGYITVNTFIRSLNGRAIRNYFSEKKVALKIIDFEGEQVFRARSTYTCIVFLTREVSDHLLCTAGSSENLTDKMPYKSYQYNDVNNFEGWSLKDSEFVAQCESVGKPFGTIYTTRSGIATLKNNVYIFKPIREDEDFYYLDEHTRIEKGICKDIVNSNLLVRESTIENIKEKIIFPYVYDEGVYPKLVDEEIFKASFPSAFAYLEKHRESLASRDKGKGKEYPVWYAFGRTQSLEKVKYKLFFPQLVRENFNSCIGDNEDLYFYNGMAAYSENITALKILQKIFQSEIFWKYVKNVSKNYNSNYYSLGKNYIKNFGIANLTDREVEKLMTMSDTKLMNIFLNKKYEIGEIVLC
ncbi:MAG: N-6 DNA methylase [Sulfuricurvum sp.]|nr:N-6 DNA methylase [Sulfuricurvum sp.]